jgi:circadian clock protein KaiB
MERDDIAQAGLSQTSHPADEPLTASLRLYVARSTPNSVRAASNLTEALANLDGALVQPSLEVIDVFAQPKRAITEGVIVTPTLVGVSAGKRIVLMGDLSDRAHLADALEDLLTQDAHRID